MRAQLVARADHTLTYPGMDDAAVAAPQHHLAAWSIPGAAAERVGWQRARSRRRGEELGEPDITADQLGRRRAEPARQRRVDEQKSAVPIDRIEADRRLVEEVDEAVLFLADHPLHLVARGDVLDMPKA